MGGSGSGRPSGSGRDTVECCRSIDVNELRRAGCLRAGRIGIWEWTQEGERVGWINLRAEHDRLHLTYRVQFGGGEWRDVAETVRIVRVPCRFGRARPYFVCPGASDGIACGRRVAQLHGPGRYFPLPALLRPRPRQPERGRMGPGCYGAPTRSGSGSAAIRAWPRHSRRSRRACGGELMSGSATMLLTLRSAAMKLSRFGPSGCWLERAKPNGRGPTPRGVSGDDRDQARFAG